jgi:hypothetical protein
MATAIRGKTPAADVPEAMIYAVYRPAAATWSGRSIQPLQANDAKLPWLLK